MIEGKKSRRKNGEKRSEIRASGRKSRLSRRNIPTLGVFSNLGLRKSQSALRSDYRLKNPAGLWVCGIFFGWDPPKIGDQRSARRAGQRCPPPALFGASLSQRRGAAQGPPRAGLLQGRLDPAGVVSRARSREGCSREPRAHGLGSIGRFCMPHWRSAVPAQANLAPHITRCRKISERG